MERREEAAATVEIPNPECWTCTIGETSRNRLPNGADLPMRDAIAEAYERITGHKPDFIFSGWGHDLSERERAVVEDRLPDRDVLAQAALAALTTDDLLALLQARSDEVVVALERDEFVVALLATDDGKPAVPPSLIEARKSFRSKLSTALSRRLIAR